VGDRGHVNTVGKPDEVAPHVRFDERRLGRLRLHQSSTLLWLGREGVEPPKLSRRFYTFFVEPPY